jgi:hypothetical protein
MIRDLWIKWLLDWLLAERHDLLVRLKDNGRRQELLVAELEERDRRRKRRQTQRVIAELLERKALAHRLGQDVQ